MHIQSLWLPFVVRRMHANRLEVGNGSRALAAKR